MTRIKRLILVHGLKRSGNHVEQVVTDDELQELAREVAAAGETADHSLHATSRR